MFFNCTNFNQPLSGWNVCNVSNMSNMFNGCTNFNQPLNNWKVPNILIKPSNFDTGSGISALPQWGASCP